MMAMAWLRASGFLLLSLLLARPLCNHLARWLVYLLFGRRSEQQLPKGTSKQSKSNLQVIIAGFPRTGTLSLLLAMETLGFPCFHGMHLKKPTTGNLFIKAFTSGDPKCWEELLDGYAAITDFPGACGYKQLMEIFPNAKIILNIRDPNKW
ncbi:hypothetical protein GOP47_0024838 [Adiantum capillus-veneris]|uniref:Sulfotransferase n=1 Tax=Adiantum capillus-veneris TaxID=13818 RepID=A0A9D4U2V0_ADICA|nr:hypothetical protein GOP47_0024838 [Adiantum capillus-veneris]